MRSRLIVLAILLGTLLGAREAAAFQVFLRTPDGNTIALEVESTDSVESLRETIAGLVGIPPERQILIYGAVVLEDGRTLADYNVLRDSTLRLLILGIVEVPALAPWGLVALGAALALAGSRRLRRRTSGAGCTA
jgi:hypothetical protein